VNDATTPPIAELAGGRRAARLTIDTEAIAENWRWFANLSGVAECAAVVKADAYGLGVKNAVPALARAGVETYFTATLAEARDVRAVLGASGRIFVLNGADAQSASGFPACDAMPVLNSLAQIAAWNGRGPCAVHIDSGMNRLGLSLHEAGEAAALLAGVKVELVMSHLACASDIVHPMNSRQRRAFIDAAAAFPRAPLSLAATAGAQIGPNYNLDMIRLGIGLYGSAGLDRDNARLHTVARITAPVLQVRDVHAGETFGYGATKAAERPMRTTIVAAGYADGYLRTASGAGFAYHNGRKLPLLGRVSMDLLIFDAAAAPDLRPGDMVELLGDHAHIDDVAAAAQTAPYEILTTFAGSVRRAQETAA